MTIRTAATALGVGLATLAASPAAAEDYWQFSLGADYSSGDYGDEQDTTMLAVPAGVKYQSDSFWFKASVPYVRIDGPDGVIPGEGGVTPGNGNGNGGGEEIVDTNVRSGIGDVNLAAAYTLRLGDRTWFDTIGRVKLPTGSKAKFIGTGTTDFTAEGELLHSFPGGVSVSVNGGRRFNGSNDLYDLNDVWLAGAGIYAKTGEQLTLGLSYDLREGALDTSPDRSEVTGFATYKLNPGLLLQGYGYTGLADGSPDIGGGVQVLFRFGAD